MLQTMSFREIEIEFRKRVRMTTLLCSYIFFLVFWDHGLYVVLAQRDKNILNLLFLLYVFSRTDIRQYELPTVTIVPHHHGNFYHQQMRDNYLNLKKAFMTFDTRLEGWIPVDDLHAILTQFTLPMSKQLFSQLMDK